MNAPRQVVPLIAAAVVLYCAAPCHAVELVVNGGFEEGAAGAMPPGWSVWGTDTTRPMGRFIRDADVANSGAAALKLDYSAGSAGYVVTAPPSALRPQPAQSYTVSFWARADRPGTAMFGLTGYASIAPFADAPIDGWQRLDVGPDWRRFSFTYDEGWDFEHDRHRHILLTFKSAGGETASPTFWIDDVAIRAAPSRLAGLVREQDLRVAPLAHRLAPRERLEITVDAARPLRPVAREIAGISFHRVCGWTGQPFDRRGRYTLDARLEEAIRELRLPMTRLYGVGDEPFGLEAALDKAAELCHRVGVPPDKVPLELETQSARTRIAPDDWARAARYSAERGYGFRLWEVANEPYAEQWGETTAFADADDYAAHVRAVSAAVRAVQPEAHIGMAISTNGWRWGNHLLRQAAGAYVVPHLYAFAHVDRAAFEDVALTANYMTLNRAIALAALAKTYNPDRDVYLYDTEWGVHSPGPNGERADVVDRNANIWGAIHRAVRLIYYAREGILRGASSWQMLNSKNAQGFGVLTQDEPERRFLLYWLYYYFNRHVGASVLDLSGTAPYHHPQPGALGRTGEERFAGPITPALATLSADGRTLFMVLANGSWQRAFPFSIQLAGFQPARAEGTLLTQDDSDARPLLEHKSDAVRNLPVTLEGGRIRGELPPHAVAFISIDGETKP